MENLWAFLKAILYGILEGITEWLPVSSTGHLILLGEFLPISAGLGLSAQSEAEFQEFFDVAIQLGAILAVVWMYFGQLNVCSKKKSAVEKRETVFLWRNLFLATLPAALVGFVGDRILLRLLGKDLDALLFRPSVVAAALILYGIAFFFVGRRKTEEETLSSPAGVDWKTALRVGCFQALAIVPGTSRSGATIFGASLLGLPRKTATEFSFFLAIPTMLGASLLKAAGFFSYLSDSLSDRLSESGEGFPPICFGLLLAAMLTAFLVSLSAIRFLLDFVQKHTFLPFGIYRILLGLLIFFCYGWKPV